MKNLYILVSLLLAGCYQPPREADRISPSDLSSTVDTYEDFRAGSFSCQYLDNIYVLDLPLEDLQDECINVDPGLVSCVWPTVSPSTDDFTIIYRRNDLPETSSHAALVHEVLHAVRGCWVYGEDGYHLSLERWRAGWETDSCPRTGAMDHRHCDVELWSTIEREAITRSGGP